MAAPHNLSFHSVLPPDQSLQTPDTSSLLLPNSNQPSNKNLSESSFQSLEELLNISGISNDDEHKSVLTSSLDLTSSLKRPSTENDETTATKKPRLDETTLSVSVGQTQTQGHIPSILSHSKSSTMSLKPHSKQTQIQSQIQSSISNATSLGTSVVFPLVNPATFGSITPHTQTNISTPVHPVSGYQKSLEVTNSHAISPTVDVTNLTSLLNQQSPIAIGSISLLVQLYKHHQAQGNIQAMQKIKEQLLTLQTKLNSKDQSGQNVLTSLSSGLPSQNNLTGAHTNKPTLSLPTPLSIGGMGSFSSSAVASHVTTGLVTNSGITLSRGSSTNNITIPDIKTTTNPLFTSSVPMYTGLISTSSVPGLMSTSSVPTYTGLMSTSSVPKSTGLISTSSVPTFAGLVSTSSVPKSTGLMSTSSVPMSTSSVPKSTGLMSTSSVPTYAGMISTSSVPKSTGLMSTSSVPMSTSSVSKSTGLMATSSITMATGLTSTVSTKPVFNGPFVTSSSSVSHSNISMGNSTGQVLSSNNILTTSTQGLTSHITSTSPSIVTHTPSTSSLNQLPLGLQVTAQTQANVLKAVYSYRLQQIQDFLASIPVSQRPTSTQELREMLIKNNVLAKALPADFLSQLQKIPENSQQTLLPESQPVLQVGPTLHNGPVSSSLPVPTSVKSEIVQSTNIPTLPKETIPSSRSVQPTSNPPTMKTPSQTTNQNVSLPGVTMETLRTLCRLPEADFVGIPMPAMLMSIVQFLRAHKWVGNSNELPLLLKQAHDAIAKNNLSNVTQQSSSVQVTKLQSGIPSQNVNKPTIQQSTSSSSPLTQYMASFGLKVSSTNTLSQDRILNNSRGSTLPFNKTPLQTTSTHTQSRPSTRYQTKAYQELLEKERLTNLQKVLQSSEEARISFRFQSHVEKLSQQLISPEVQRPFSSWQDLTLRLLPYHVYGEPKLPQGAMEKADAVYEGIAGVLLSRGVGLMSRYQQMLIREEEKSGNDSSSIVLNRLWLESEREKKIEETTQQKQEEEISTVEPVNDHIMDIDPFLLDSDSCIDDPFLSQIWNGSSDGLQERDFSMGIT